MYFLLRFFKLLGVVVLFCGTIGAFVPRELRDRRVFAYALAGPGFGLAWAFGFGLAAFEEVSLLSGWILGAMALSFFSLQVVLFAVGKEGRRGPWTCALAVGSLVATLALMVWKP